MIRSLLLAAGLALPLLSYPAAAATLDHVRAAGVVQCGAAIRPGLAFPTQDGVWHGLQVELCRAVAAATLGDPDRIAFRSYVLRDQFAHAADGEDDVSFLSASELAANGLFGRVLPGPAVFYQTTRVLVWSDSKVAHVADLAGVQVCAEPGTGPERNLQSFMAAHHIAFGYSMWQEVEEMMDAFNVGRCPAVAGEETALAALRYGAESEGHPSRILPEPLGVSPLFAATASADPAWSQIVTWVVQTALATDAAEPVQGPALQIPAPELGLLAGWQDRVRAVTGTYAALFDRTLGAHSPLELAPGVNARWDEGGLFAPATVE